MSTQAQDGTDRLFLVEFVGGILTVMPLGDVESFRWPEVEDASQRIIQSLSLAPGARILVDMSKLRHCGSAFLGLVLRVWKSMCPQNGVLAFCNVNEDVAAVLRQTRLETLWTVYPTREAAYAVLQNHTA